MLQWLNCFREAANRRRSLSKPKPTSTQRSSPRNTTAELIQGQWKTCWQKIRKTSREISIETWSIVCNLRSMNQFLPCFLAVGISVSHKSVLDATSWLSMRSRGANMSRVLEVLAQWWAWEGPALQACKCQLMWAVKRIIQRALLCHIFSLLVRISSPEMSNTFFCQDTGTLRQSKLTAATLESIVVTHAQAMSIQLQLNKKLANVIQGCAIQCEKHQKSFQLKSMSRRFSRHQATELDLQNLDHHVVALPMASIQHLNLVLIILDRKTAWTILSFKTICIFRVLTHEKMYQVEIISWSTCLMVQSAHES